MPLFMDIHQHVEGLTGPAVAQAHAADLATQQKYGVKYLRYWFDEGTRQGFLPGGSAHKGSSRGGASRGAWLAGGRDH